jgi:hypothetical protein
VLDVPAKLAARARVFDSGQGRKTDADDAHAVVMVALRDRGLREVVVDADLQVLRLLVIAGMRCPGPTSRVSAARTGSSPSCCPAGRR